MTDRRPARTTGVRSPSSPAAARRVTSLPALAVADALVAAGHDSFHDPLRRRRAGCRDPPAPRDAVPARRSSTSSGCSAGSPARIWDSSRRWCAAPGPRRACCASGGRASSCRSADTPACRRCSPPGGSASPSWSCRTTARRAGQPTGGTIRRSLCGRLRALAAAACGADRRAGTPGDPRRRPSSVDPPPGGPTGARSSTPTDSWSP